MKNNIPSNENSKHFCNVRIYIIFGLLFVTVKCGREVHKTGMHKTREVQHTKICDMIWNQ